MLTDYLPYLINTKFHFTLNQYNTTLNKFDRVKQKVFRVGKNDRFPKDAFSIIDDTHGNLWISTVNGVIKYNPFTKQLKNYSNIKLSFGYKMRNGELYFISAPFFSNKPSIMRFDSDSLQDNSFIPPVVITSFRKFEKPFPFGKTIELNYTENFLSFEFSALSYISPEKNQYAYKMEGVDKDWVYSGTRRFASYPNMNPGEYIFRVKGSNNDGVWNEAGTSITIIISPPFWKTWWAYLSYAGFFIFALYGIRRYEMNRISYKNQVKVDTAVLKEKEETEKIKSRFFANISHEFRTPLTLILGPAEKIEKNESANPVKDAGIITRNSRRLLQLVNQLLDLSKLDAGKLKLEASPANIISFIKGIALSFESLSESRDIMVKIKSDKEFVEVYFDKEKMFKTFSNLLSNAFKFTPERGNVVINIAEITNKFVQIRIRNIGIGIPKKELPKLFDRFYQVDSSQTKEYEGTGIGLALVKELIELHHGTISVDSEEVTLENKNSNWTEFTITLPIGKTHLKKEELLTTPEEFEQPEIEIEEDKILQTKNTIITDSLVDDFQMVILVVEDNYDMREYIKESLSANYKVEEAVNGEQGIRIAQKITPDLIISDLMMPKVDGIELTRVLKEDEKTSHIPIIILTAKSGQENLLDGLTVGADEYLTKPFDIKELQIRISNLINLRKKIQEKIIRGEISDLKIQKKLRGIDEKFINKVNEVIAKHVSEEEFSIEEFGNEIGMSRSQFHRKLKALVGKSGSLYLRSVRLNKAKKMLENGEGNVSEISYKTGFSSPSYFSKCFKEEFGFPPSDII